MINKKNTDIICALLLVFVTCSVIYLTFKPSVKNLRVAEPAQARDNQLLSDKLTVQTVNDTTPHDSNGFVNVKLNYPSVLSFKTKKEILDARKGYLLNEINYPNYVPNEEVFGQIIDNKPWISLKAASCYWSKNIKRGDGISEESIFINNPLALIMLEMPYYGLINNPNCSGNYYFFPKALMMNASEKEIVIKYNLTDFLRHLPEDRRNTKVFMLKALNARDLGYQWGMITNHVNVDFNDNSMINSPYQFLDFIHLGSSCGVEGGCNNGSPFQAPFNFAVTGLPAEITIKLWTKKPVISSVNGDYNYKIIME